VAHREADSGERGDQLAVYRSETSYSFVDKSVRDGTRRRSERPESPAGGAHEVEAAHPAPTRVGWSSPAPTDLATRDAHPVSLASRPPDFDDSEIVSPRSAPPSWRVGPAIADPVVQSELRALCDQLLAFAARQQRCFVVAVTSDAEADPGKSRTAARLATMLASDGRARVLLIEADFDFPSVQRLMAIEMPPASGFSQQMRNRLKLGERRPWVVVRCSDSLHVLGEGIVRSPGILFSQEFSDAVAELRRCYDVIVLDGPLAGVGADHKPIDAVTDGIVYVVKPGSPPEQGLDRASHWFKRKDLVAAVPAETAATR
jgi:Mrp family chromosome partitioning ATPase